jgi:hypothetical protein
MTTGELVGEARGLELVAADGSVAAFGHRVVLARAVPIRADGLLLAISDDGRWNHAPESWSNCGHGLRVEPTVAMLEELS